MSSHRLLLRASATALPSLPRSDFLWRRDDSSSMDTSLGPRLERLGPVPELHVDFVRLAAVVFFVDRTVPRPRGWARELQLEIPVSDPDRWSSVSDELATALNTLTGDFWTLTFNRPREPRRIDAAPPHDANRVVLFSGGADSTSGAALALAEDRGVVLASHHDWSNTRGQQNAARRELTQIFGNEPINFSWRLGRTSRQVGSGVGFGEERSRRSRSIVFVALGLALAAVSDAELWVPENGFTSLNPPLSGERRGALSTRTTHPGFLDAIADTLDRIGLHVKMVNPFEQMTKGEVFIELREVLGNADALQLLASTNSCAKPGRDRGFAPDTHCGVCLGCLVRRAAFIAAGLNDATLYREEAMNGERRRVWLSPARRQTYESVRYRVAVGYEIDDILDLGLPDRVDLEKALELARRGLSELAAVEIS